MRKSEKELREALARIRIALDSDVPDKGAAVAEATEIASKALRVVRSPKHEDVLCFAASDVEFTGRRIMVNRIQGTVRFTIIEGDEGENVCLLPVDALDFGSQVIRAAMKEIHE